jgi:tetratricopeptide (TPR) repeat protein
MRRGQPPPFYELDEYTFQDVCRDLLDAQPDIATCDLYGERGQRQDGIDLYARRTGGDGIEVGQCKCYTNFPPQKIREASDEFFAHWERRWSKENVRRFVLLVACGLDRRQQQDEITKQTQRFREVGIDYEVWAAAKIHSKLSPHREIARRYLEPGWVDIICGPETTLPTPAGVTAPQVTIVDAALVNLAEGLAGLLSDDARSRLAEAREALREGRISDARAWLERLQADHTRWSALALDVKGQVLRFEAVVELNTTGDVVKAGRLLDNVAQIAPAEDVTVVRALLIQQTDGAEAALDVLDKRDDADSLNLRAAFQLELGRLDDARATLDHAAQLRPSNAETLRLRALYHFARGELTEADLAAQRAFELAPRWKGVRFVAAGIRYFGALSPLAVPSHFVAWPEPTDWMLVKRDDESLDRLRAAADTFADLVALSVDAPEERASFAAWRLACLGTDPERQEEAIAYCQTLLDKNPADYRAIAWALARRWAVDLNPCAAVIDTMVTVGRATLPHIVALVRIRLAIEDGEQAWSVLESTKPDFEKEGAGELWNVLRMHAEALRGTSHGAARGHEEDGDSPSWTVQAMILETTARETGDWAPLIQHFERGVAATGDPRMLLEYCELMASRGQWAFVAGHAEWLVREVGTADALRLSAVAAFNDNQAEKALRLIDEYLSLFPGGRLPNHLRRLRIRCQERIGILREAITEAEALARDEPTTEHLLELAQLHADTGNLRALALVSRQLLHLPDLAVSHALALANGVYLEDRQVAVSLWKRAVDSELTDDEVVQAVDLGFRLGIEADVAPLWPRFWGMASRGQGGVRAATIDDFIALATQRRERGQQLAEAYAQSQAPIHFLFESWSVTLAELYHWQLRANEVALDPLHQPLLLARHGGRPTNLEIGASRGTWRLNLDITSFLLAAHIGILDIVESTFGSLRVSASLAPALVRMRADLLHEQPARLQSQREVLRLLEEKKVEVMQFTLPADYPDATLVELVGNERVALLEAARRDAGYVLDFLPWRTQDARGVLKDLPSEVELRLVNCRAVADALLRDGPLSEADYERAIRALGSEGVPRTAVIPKQRDVLFCYANVPEVLADAALLAIACERFQVRIERAYIDEIQATLQNHERRQELATWLEELIDRLNDAIHTGAYEIIPPRRVDTPGVEGARQHRPEEQCLLDLLRPEPGTNDVLWVDDRFVNSYLRCESAPILGIHDVLKELLTRGAIDASAYFEKLLVLRAANVRYLPLEADEILHHLRQAQVVDGAIVETQALSTLRRYVAACLLQRDLIQRPPLPTGASNPHGEIGFVLGLRRAASQALVDVWLDTGDERTAAARAEWILTGLYLDGLGLAEVALSLRQDVEPLQVEAAAIAGLMSLAITATSPSSSWNAEARNRYLRWISERVLDKRFGVDPYLVPAVADSLKDLLDTARQAAAEEGYGPVATAILQRLFDQLPGLIQEELARDTDFMANIAVQYREVLSAQDVKFEPDAFFAAAAEAVNGRTAMIRAIDPPVDITLRPSSDSTSLPVCYFDHPITGEAETIGGEEFGLLRESIAAREATLRQLRRWFDCPAEVFERVLAEIVLTEVPGQRVAKARAWREASVAVHLDAIHRAVRERNRRLRDLLPRQAQGLLRHFRLDSTVGPGPQFAGALDAAAVSLAEDGDLQETFERLAGIPVSLPPSFLEGVRSLTGDGRRALIKALVRSVRSPLAGIHLARLLLEFGDEQQSYQRLARRIVKRALTEDGLEAWEALVAVARWVDDELSLRSEARGWTSPIRIAIAWAYAHRLYSVLVTAGVPVSLLHERFGRPMRQMRSDLIEWNPEYLLDAARPHRVRPADLALAGIAYALGDHTAGVVDEQLQARVLEKLFMEIGGRVFPTLLLLRDETQAGDDLQSFLGGDRGVRLATLVGGAAADFFTRGFLQAAIESAVDKLGDMSDRASAWRQLAAVLGDLPPYDTVRDRLAAGIRQTDFASLLEENVDTARIAIYVASQQAGHLGDDELRSYLKAELIKIATFFANRATAELDAQVSLVDDDNAVERLSHELLEAALALARGSRRAAGEAIADFAHIVALLVDAWPKISLSLRSVIQRLCEELPVVLTPSLWRVLVRLRAE